MDQDKKQEEIIERLKAEGQLVRNTGTNSLKSIKVELEKFSIIFEAMNESIINQGDILLDILDVQKQILGIEEDTAEKEKRRRDLESVEKTVIEDKVVETSVPQKMDFNGIGDSMSGFFKRIGPGLGGFLGAALGGAAALLSPSLIGRKLITAIPIITLAPFIADFVTQFIESGLKDLSILNESGFQEETKKGLSSAIKWPLIGFALGGWWGARIGAILGAGMWIWEQLDEMFSLEENMKKIANAVGLEISDETLSAIGSAIGIAIAAILPTIIKKAIWPLLKRGAATIAAGAAGAAAGAASLRRLIPDRTSPGTASRIAERFRSVGRSAARFGTSAFRFGGPAAAVGVVAAGGAAAIQRVESYAERIIDENPQLTESQRSFLRQRTSLVELRNLIDNPEMLEDFLRARAADIRQMPIRRNDEPFNIPQSTIDQPLSPIFDNGIREQLENFLNENSEIPQMRQGSNGIENFGQGTLAKLHGMEAVVPINTPAGKMIYNNFDENFQPKFSTSLNKLSPILDKVSQSAMNTANIIFAPTNVAPVTSISNGGSSVASVTNNSVTSFGGNGGGIGLGKFAV